MGDGACCHYCRSYQCECPDEFADHCGDVTDMVSHPEIPDNCTPTVPGWYWCTRRFAEPRWAIVFVMECDINNGNYIDCEFRGPIPEPEQ